MQSASKGRGRSSTGEGKREGWENKAFMVVAPARPGRAAVAGASYVMWLAGPTSQFRSAAHTNPSWGTNPALEEKEEIEVELWGKAVEVWDYKNFSLSSAPNRTHRHLPSELHCWKITVKIKAKPLMVGYGAQLLVLCKQSTCKKLKQYIFTLREEGKKI